MLNTSKSLASLLLLMLSFFTLISFSNTKALPTTGKCVNPQGKKVSWYVMFTMSNQYNKTIYFDKSLKTYLTLKSEVSTFPPMKIVAALKEKSRFNSVVWNDDSIKEDRSKDGFSKIAHSKGMLLVDMNDKSQEGTLLIHSLPRFPKLLNDETFSEEFNENWGVYAQTWVCLTLDSSTVLDLVKNMKNLALPIQWSNVTNDPASEVTIALNNLLEKKRGDRNQVKMEFKTKDKDLSLTYFIRPDDPEINLPYDFDIPQHFKSSIFVGTWTKPSLQKSICNEDYQVINITEFNVLGMRYKNTQDHSKWAVTEKDKGLCIGDLNRTDSQLNRSGAMLCLEHPLLSKLSRQFIYESEDCEDTDTAAALKGLKLIEDN